jgi:hypothetical protein
LQEGPVQVLRRQVAVVRVAGRGGRPRGPAQASGEAAQDVAELRRRPQGRAPAAPPLRARQEGGQGAAVVAEETDDADAAAGDGGSGGGGRATSVICLGDFAGAPVKLRRRDAFFYLLGLGVDLGNEMAKGNLAMGVWTPRICKYFERELTRYVHRH